MIVISNTSPLFYFASVGKLSLLKELYYKIYIPNAVWEEIPSNLRIDIKFEKTEWLIIQDPEKDKFKEVAISLFHVLGRGESYAIALSLELEADYLLINDQEAKDKAEEMGIKTKWITEVLLDAAEKKVIKDFQEFLKIFEKMIENGLWIKKEHYNKVIEKAKEVLI
ncbi:MAG: hypothetical protein EU529_16680 [Promethearchaeota archaeon]|nr:MAG: hypothetical protein EU529_16680 [Candidatus Lokiarchaeota archaeon]